MENERTGCGEILLYSDETGKEFVSVVFKDETFWLTQKAMAELFDVNAPAVSKHLQNIYEEQELSRDATISKMETVRQEGDRQRWSAQFTRSSAKSRTPNTSLSLTGRWQNI